MLHPPASIVTVVMMMMVMEEVVTMMKVSMVKKIVKRMLMDHIAVPKQSAITNWMINADLQMTIQSELDD